MSYVDKIQGGGITWGSILAGAAVVSGAVLLAPAFGLDTVADSIKNAVVDMATTTPEEAAEAAAAAAKSLAEAKDAGPSFFEELGGYLKENAPTIAGAALVGGGAASLMRSEKNTAYVVNSTNVPPATHVENEQMRAIQGLMKARMMAANPEMAQQMMGGRA